MQAAGECGTSVERPTQLIASLPTLAVSTMTVALIGMMNRLRERKERENICRKR